MDSYSSKNDDSGRSGAKNRSGRSCIEEESGLFTPIHFKSVFERELARLDRGGKPLSLTVLAPPKLTAEDWASFGRALEASLRRIDLAARLTDGLVAVLQPECDPLRARRWLARLGDDLRQAGHPAAILAAGRASALPWEGREAGELMAQARANIRDLREPEAGENQGRDDDHDSATAIAADERNLLFDGFKNLGVG